VSLVLNDLLRNAAERRSDALALLAPGRNPMSYRRLWGHVQQVAGTLHTIGIGHSDRIAVVLPDGPEMASTFLAISAAAVCAPLNPNYRTNEFEFYLSDLNPRALILEAGTNSPAASVARSRGIRVIELVPQIDAEAGVFSFAGIPLTQINHPVARYADEPSMILHTSGTTSRPKMVPLTQANLCSSAQNIVASLLLSAEDRCLNVMPLFHIHGLVGALLSSIAAGSSVVCTPGFHSLHFFDWIEEFQPTWYTAVPTMHQAILARAAHNPGIHSRSRLRFIRSCSSALPPKLMAELEDEFQVPLVEAYGMTEASHQMSINPLPPGIRKPGSVGLPAGCEIAVLDESGALLPAGAIGAVAIRGPNVTHGYENNLEANKSSFSSGWFRTGDQGKLDSAGYLFLTGRTKEIINRGGEKISPREVDEVLLEHPAVAQAMAFAIPDERLGEDIGAAVVLHEHIACSGSRQLEIELREFAAGKLALFKVPRQILFLKEIPKGPTGKPQRIGIAAKLGLKESTRAGTVEAYVPPQSELELQIVKIWEELLRTRPVGVRHDFFKLGGDSLLAVRMMAQIEAACGVRLPVSSLLPAATVENLASAMLRAQREEVRSPIVAIQPQGSQPPLFFLHGQWRGGGLYCSDLARLLGNDQPFFAIVPHGLDGRPVPRSIKAMATDRARDLLENYPVGPIRLGGYCNGALVAFEMARQLQGLGRNVDLLILVETHAPNIPFRRIWSLVGLASTLLSLGHNAQAELFLRLRTFQLAWCQASQNGTSAVGAFLLRKLRNIATRVGRLAEHSPSVASSPSADHTADAHADPVGAIDSYVPGSYKSRVVLLRTEDIGSQTANFSALDDPSAGWAEVAPQVQVYWLPGNHETIVRDQLDGLARQLVQCFDYSDSFPAAIAPSLGHPRTCT
jgi:acyl-CoA synthetase (AMP-forming)/AMP-acid ligase II/thioesterase domain-containing protein/acyl carrier protein